MEADSDIIPGTGARPDCEEGQIDAGAPPSNTDAGSDRTGSRTG